MGRRLMGHSIRRDLRDGGGAAGAPVDPGTDPATVATCTLANVRNTGITGDPASAWADQVGTAQDLAQASGPSQPGVSVDGALEFDGVDDYMGDITLGDIVDADGYTMWIVVSIDAAAPGGATPGIFCVPTTTAWGLFCQRITGIDYMRFNHSDGVAGPTPDVAITLSTLYAVRVRYDGSDVYLRVAGTEVNVAAGSLSSVAGTVRLGVGGSNFSPQMTVHDIYVYDSHLDATTRDGIDDWLVANRGATL